MRLTKMIWRFSDCLIVTKTAPRGTRRCHHFGLHPAFDRGYDSEQVVSKPDRPAHTWLVAIKDHPTDDGCVSTFLGGEGRADGVGVVAIDHAVGIASHYCSVAKGDTGSP